MARLTVAVAVLFLFFFAVSHGRTPFDFLENDAVDRQMQNTFPDSDGKPTIFLPSEKTDDSAASDAKPLQSADDLPESETDSTDAVNSVPLTLINFRPINRRPIRPMPFRIGRRCRHHHLRPHMARLEVFREVPYGDDMLLAGDEFRPEEYRGDNGKPIFPARRVRFPHSWPAFPHPRFHHHHPHAHPHHHYDDGAFRWGDYRRGPFQMGK